MLLELNFKIIHLTTFSIVHMRNFMFFYSGSIISSKSTKEQSIFTRLLFLSAIFRLASTGCKQEYPTFFKY